MEAGNLQKFEDNLCKFQRKLPNSLRNLPRSSQNFGKKNKEKKNKNSGVKVKEFFNVNVERVRNPLTLTPEFLFFFCFSFFENFENFVADFLESFFSFSVVHSFVLEAAL